MYKRIYFFIFLAAIVGLFELQILYLGPQEISFGSYVSNLYATIFSPASTKTIRINLYNKSLTLLDKGELVKQAKIAAAGNPKSSATPVGNFKVSLKDKRHVSAINSLIMPFSLRFNGPYYLHGLPTTLSGQLINTLYSHGCVRLPAGLDEEIFNWADIGTKVEIYNSSLVKSDDSSKVYYLNTDGTKEPISNPDEFLRRGFHWQDIQTIPSVELDALTTA